MGQMKRLMMEQQEGGYSQMPGERYVCPACVTDQFMIEALENSLEDEACSYCGTVPSADLLVLLDQIADYVATEFEDPPILSLTLVGRVDIRVWWMRVTMSSWTLTRGPNVRT